jgi:HPt (histidine-containing phosphotransfer) domain-containing protein
VITLVQELPSCLRAPGVLGAVCVAVKPGERETKSNASKSEPTIQLSLNRAVGLMSVTGVVKNVGMPVWSLTPDLREIAIADAGMLQELVSLFIEDSTVRLEILTRACFRQDFKVIRAQVHSLKGSALQMGAVGLASLCAALEAADKPEPDRGGPMMRAIEDEFVKVRLAMEGYLVHEETGR